jgi:signal peptidase
MPSKLIPSRLKPLLIWFFGLLSVITLLISLPKFPIKAFVVLSGSMRPRIWEGSVVLVRRGADHLKVSDVITFIKPDNFSENVTHRIIKLTTKDNKTYFLTRGDANNVDDHWVVRRESIWGKVILTIPLFGFLIAFSQTKIGVILVFVIPAVLIIVGEIISVVKEIKKISFKKKAVYTVPLFF